MRDQVAVIARPKAAAIQRAASAALNTTYSAKGLDCFGLKGLAMTCVLGMAMGLLSACDMVQEPVETYERPTDVKALLGRAASCEHWAGEEAYDRARGKEILQAVHRLRCEALDDDYAALRQKYASDDAVSEDLHQASRKYGFEPL